MRIFFVFDVESIGLHGEGFSVGYVVVEEWGSSGGEIESGYFGCNSDDAAGLPDNRDWVNKHIPHRPPNCSGPDEVRRKFWKVWKAWKTKQAILAADCCWPVETNFLSECVALDPVGREWEGPYPLIDIGSVLLACGKDPLGKFPRLPSEMPEHDPEKDARQSARILLEALKVG